MPKKLKKAKRKKPSSNPLNNINFKPLYENTETSPKGDKYSIRQIEGEYKRILQKSIQREHRAYRVVYKNHPDLLFIAFAKEREPAKYQASKYFKDIFHPFFTGEGYSEEMLNSRAYRVKELDEYGLKGVVPIPKLLQVLDISMSCSICKKGNFTYSDYIQGECFIIEGEGNLNPFTKGYLLCHECYKKYIKNTSQ